MTVDFGHGPPSPVRVKRSATRSWRPAGPEPPPRGRWRLEYVRSLSDAHDV